MNSTLRQDAQVPPSYRDKSSIRPIVLQIIQDLAELHADVRPTMGLVYTVHGS
jgi:hypothetical protein